MILDEKEIRAQMQEVIDQFSEDLKAVRTGRLNNESFQRVDVDTSKIYGAWSPLNSVSKISIVSGIRAEIEVWDSNILLMVQKALEESPMGFKVSSGQAKNTLVVNISPMTTEMRERLVKDLSKVLEEKKVRLRKVRQELVSFVEQIEKVPEDEQFRTKEKIQSILKEFEQLLQKIFLKKEEELMAF